MSIGMVEIMNCHESCFAFSTMHKLDLNHFHPNADNDFDQNINANFHFIQCLNFLS